MRASPRFYIGKHPCDDLPYVHGVDPDPRSGDPHFTFDGPDYSGWYVKQPFLITEQMTNLAGWEIHKAGTHPSQRYPDQCGCVDVARRALTAALSIESPGNAQSADAYDSPEMRRLLAAIDDPNYEIPGESQ